MSFQGFSKLDRKERFQKLLDLGLLLPQDFAYLNQGGIQSLDLAEKWIENALGYFQLPLGIATHFAIDKKSYTIPMAVEETSIIAALSKSAKWIVQHGEITTEVVGDTLIGQIQIARVNDWERLQACVAEHTDRWIEAANVEVAAGLVRRGGGVKSITLRRISRCEAFPVEVLKNAATRTKEASRAGMPAFEKTQQGTPHTIFEEAMAVIHVHTHCCDAMGANIINQILEYLKPSIEAHTHEKVTMCILSNLNDNQVTHARVELNHIDAELGERIEEASYFAEWDPYRAATHNKGVLNGIDPVIIATGNDWRAVEAGVHSYAARSGQYRAVTKWRWNSDIQQLVGEFEAPIVVGVVGGVTKLHPTAQLCLKMMDIQSAQELSRVAGAVGLVQNLGALRALTTIGIVEGHMKLHIDNLTMSAGATANEIPWLKARLEQFLSFHKRVSLNQAVEFLKELRASKDPSLVVP